MSQKICVVGLRGFPDVMGGIETHCEYLYSQLAVITSSYQVTVLARRPYIGRRDYDWRGIRIVSIWTVKQPLLETALHTFLAIFYARFLNGARLLHLHAVGPALFAPMARLLGMRLVATHHGADYERQKWGAFAKFCLRLGERCMILSADRVICVSASQTAALRRRYPRAAGRIAYIPNGVHVGTGPANPAAILEKLGVEAGAYILSVSRLVPEKGHGYLVQAFHAAATPFKLVIAGGADHDSEFVRGLKRVASSSVIFAGQLPREEVLALCRNAAVFVHPSFHEGMPIAALEALGAGCAVLLSDIAAHRDIGLPERHYFEVGNVAMLARRLAQPSFDDLRVRGDALLRQFDWREIAASTLEVFETVAPPHG